MYLRYICMALFSISCQNVAICTQEKQIIIIGAGSAGIAAATRLLENGIENFFILEAEPRIGGRIYSTKFGNSNVDVGAMWCHGQQGNIVWEKLVDLNLTDLVRSTLHAETINLSTRKKLEKEFEKELINIMTDIVDESPGNEYQSTGTIYENIYNKTITEKYGNDREKLKIARSAIKWLEHISMSMEGSLSWYDVKSMNSYEECEGNQHLNWRGPGYKIFLDVLMKKYPQPNNSLPIDDKILLNKEITKISWDPSVNTKRVTLSCADDSEYVASHVIFTPSIGVLKEKASELFVPELPERKKEAIRRIGIGAVMKVFLHYPRKWWTNVVGFNFVWEEDDMKNAKNEFPGGLWINGESWVTRLYSVEMLEENPNVLLVWITGDVVPALETMDEGILVSGIQYTMKKFLGHIYDIPKPDQVLRSNWYANPHFKGTYSFQSMSSTANTIPNLLEPLSTPSGSPIILFAGEATSLQHFSTVHGAIESGYREADRLIAVNKYPLLIKTFSKWS